MPLRILLIIAIALLATRQSEAVQFYEYPDEFDSVEVIYPEDSDEFWPASNLIQGPGVGFEEDEPHDEIGPPGGGAESDWVTTADCGFPADFVECVGSPVIELDLGGACRWMRSASGSTVRPIRTEARVCTSLCHGSGRQSGLCTGIELADVAIEDYFDFAFEETP